MIIYSADTLRACLAICRVGNLPTVWSNVLVAVTLSLGQFSLPSVLLLSGALSLLYAGGMCLNDVCDAATDREQRPERPIPSGALSISAAGLLADGLFCSGLLLLALSSQPVPALLAGGLLLLVIVGYDLFHKGNPASVLLMASCRFLVFMVSALAVVGEIRPEVVFAGAVQGAYVLVISAVARWENARRGELGRSRIPNLLAGIAVLDGILLAILQSPPWLAAGLVAAGMTSAGQRLFRGD